MVTDNHKRGIKTSINITPLSGKGFFMKQENVKRMVNAAIDIKTMTVVLLCIVEDDELDKIKRDKIELLTSEITLRSVALLRYTNKYLDEREKESQDEDN
jgi:hypothetical protein